MPRSTVPPAGAASGGTGVGGARRRRDLRRWRPGTKAGKDEHAEGRQIMTLLRTFTPRMYLILAHDLLATAIAVLASFYIRFEDQGLADRWHLHVIVMPVYVIVD